MAFLENGIWCSAAEYERDRERRVCEGSLRVQDMYAMVIRVDSTKRDAAKLAVRLLKNASGILQIAFLDLDLNPVLEAEGAMTNGFMNKIDGARVKDQTVGASYPIQQAFFKDYFEDQFGGILDVRASLSAVS